MEAEPNVLGCKIWIKFYDSNDTKLHTEKVMSDSGGYGYFEYT